MVLTSPACICELEEFNVFLTHTRLSLGAGNLKEDLAFDKIPSAMLYFFSYERRHSQTKSNFRSHPGYAEARSVRDA